MPKQKGTKTHQKACDLCCDLLEDSQEVLACEGGCNINVHRYCAGVTRYHYSKLTTGTNPFVCQFCALKTYGALVKQLQSEVERLKSELASTKPPSRNIHKHRGMLIAQPQVIAKTVNQLQLDVEEIKIELAGTKACYPLREIETLLGYAAG